MCEFLNLPIMFLKDFTGRETIEELYERADYRLFNATYADKYDNYAGFLARNGIAHNLSGVQESAPERSVSVHSSGIMRLLHELKGKSLDERLVLDTIMARYEPDRSHAVRKMAEAKEYDVALSGAASDGSGDTVPDERRVA